MAEAPALILRAYYVHQVVNPDVQVEVQAMKRFIIGFAWLISAAGFGALTCAAQSSVTGEWLGGYEIKGDYTPIKTRFNLEGTGIKGTLEFPQREVTGIALAQVRFSSSNLHFELP